MMPQRMKPQRLHASTGAACKEILLLSASSQCFGEKNSFTFAVICGPVILSTVVRVMGFAASSFSFSISFLSSTLA